MTDFDAIRKDYPLPQIIEAAGTKLIRNGKEWIACCPFHAEATESFTVYTDKSGAWKFHCFGCGAHGDNLDFVKERYGCDVLEAARIITGDEQRSPKAPPEYRKASDPYAGYDIGRPPADAPLIEPHKRTPAILNPKRVDDKTGKPKVVTYTPTMVFPYRTKNGDLIGYVLRVEFDGRKITPGVWWANNKAAGFTGWSHGSYPSPRPMYGLEDLHANPTHQVLLVEGEKCRDAAKRLMAGKKVVAMSWMGGGKSLSKTFWKSLHGRSVVIWPDNDEEGWRTALGYADSQMKWHKGLVDYCYEAGATAVKVVHVTPDSRPKGWDIADAEKEGLGQRGVELIIRDRIQAWPADRHRKWKKQQIEAAGPQRSEDDDKDDHVGAPNTGAAQQDTVDANRQDGSGGKRTAERGVDKAVPQQNIQVQTGRGFAITDETWRQHLIMKADGDGLKPNSLQNFALLLQYEARFAGVFAWNDFAKHVFIMRRPPWDISTNPGKWQPRKMTDPDVTSTACWLEYCGMSPKRNDIGAVIDRVAQHNKYDPLLQHLNALQWDGHARLSGSQGDDPTPPWLTKYMGAADTAENRAFGRKWMIGAVARALQPGCKVDTMLVIEGPQGLKKSTALRVLADAIVPGLFTDEISDPNSKDAAMQMQGAWIIEIAELDAFRRAEITQIKAWLSRQTDRFRRPYGKIVEDFERRCIFAGTVNPIGIGYLKDPSGGRRFWPFEAGKIDLDALKADAQQLWAEAVAAFKDGEAWWLDEDESVYAKIAQEARYEEDPYNEMIDTFIANRTTVSLIEVMKDALEIPPERRNAIVAKRVASHLHSRGWARIADGKKTYYTRRDRMV